MTHNPHNPDLPFFETEPIALAEFSSISVQYHNVVELPVTPQQLFEVFEDPNSWPQWATGIGAVEWTSPKPFTTGTTRTVRFWGGMEVYEEFIDWKDGERMAFTFLGITESIWSRFGETYKVDDLGADGCRLTWRVAYEPTGWFSTFHFFIRPMMALGFRGFMWRLRRYCKRNICPQN